MNWGHFFFLGVTAPLWLPVVMVGSIVAATFLPLFIDTSRARRAREVSVIKRKYVLIGDTRVPR